MTIANAELRDKRLDALADAVNSWADKRKARLEKEATLLKAILKGRTGSERLNNVTVQSANDLAVDEINDFLAGDL